MSKRQRIHERLRRVVSMRVSIALVTLMMTAIVLSIPTSIAEAQNDGSTQTITVPKYGLVIQH